MQAIQSLSPIVRAIGIIGAVAALVTSITFAALSDTATLQANNLSSDTADLQVSNGGAYGDTVTGFDAAGIVPGNGETFDFYLSNASSFDMDITVEVPGDCITYVSGSNGIPDCDDVLISFTDTEAPTATVDYTLQQLIDGPVNVPGNPLGAGEAGVGPAADGDAGDFQVTLDLEAADLSGSSAALDAPFDLVFAGTQVVTP